MPRASAPSTARICLQRRAFRRSGYFLTEEDEGREQDGPELGQHETRPGKGQLERADRDHQE